MKLNRKLWRDLWVFKFQFLTIFLMTFLGVFAFSGVHAYMDGLQVSGDTYYDMQNLQDLWVNASTITDENLNEIKEIDGIKDANRAFSVNAKLKGNKKVTLETNVIEGNTVSKLYAVKGKGYSNKKNCVWLDSYLADSLDVKVGDTLKLDGSGKTLKLKVEGLVISPDHVYFVKDSTQVFPTHDSYGFVYISADTYKEQILNNQMDVPYTKCYITLKSQKNMNAVKKELRKMDSVISVTDRDANISYKGFQNEIDEGQTYSSVFSGMFLFIALLSVMSTMNRFVKKQRVQIGTLKALGFSNRKITMHYVSFGFVISLLASVLGLIVGTLTLGNMFVSVETGYFELPSAHIVILPIVYILAVVVVLIVSLVTYLSSRSILKETASQALRLEAPKVKEKNLNWTVNLFKCAKLSTKWNIRDMARNKARTFASLVGVVGCTALLVCSFGLYDSMNAYLDWQFETLNQYKNKIVLNNDYTQDQYNQLVDKYGDDTSETLSIECKVDHKIKTNVLTINDSHGKLAYTNHNKKQIKLKTNGIYLSEKLADQYNLKKGDKIKWHVIGSDSWYTSEIVGLNRDPQSQQLNMTRSYYESLDCNYRADTIYTNKNAKKIEGVSKVAKLSDIRKDSESMLNTMKMMMFILIFLAVLLGSVILYNLGILSYTEKQYQFATLKVLGFQDKQIKDIFVKQNTWIMIVAICIGLPFGFGMTDYIYKVAIGDNYDFSASIRLISYVIATIGTFGVSYFINCLLARKIKTIDMVTSLKGNE